MKNSEVTVYWLSALTVVLTAVFFVVAISLGTGEFFHSTLSGLDQKFNAVPLSLGFAQLLLFFTYLANPVTVIILEAALFLLFVLLRRRLLSLFFIGGLIFGEALVFLLKIGFNRARPPLGFYDLTRSGYAFPSGHALMATVLYGFMGYCLVHLYQKRWQKVIIIILTIFIIGLIGVSRILLGFHWFSDVLGGWLLGGAVLSMLIAIFIHVHDHIIWQPFSIPHGIRFLFMILIVMAIGFFVLSFYVTHPLQIRSTITTPINY
jgi:undecaprenyl-diphosphatase